MRQAINEAIAMASFAVSAFSAVVEVWGCPHAAWLKIIPAAFLAAGIIFSFCALWQSRWFPYKPSAQPSFRDKWAAAMANMKTVLNQKFQYQEIVLDGYNWVNCDFNHVALYYDGTAPMSMSHCSIDEDTKKRFHSHNPAMASFVELLRTVGAIKEGIQFAILEEPQGK